MEEEETREILSLLDERDGKLQQKDIAEELGWSQPKTSQRVRYLEDEGDVEVYTIGRSNIIYDPDEKPDILE